MVKKIDYQQRIMYVRIYAERNKHLSASDIHKHIKGTDKGLSRNVIFDNVKEVRNLDTDRLINNVAQQKGIRFENKQRIIADIKEYKRKYQYKKIDTLRTRLFSAKGAPIFEAS